MTKLSREFESKSPEKLTNAELRKPEVGFAAIQEMARLQEEALLRDDKKLSSCPSPDKSKLEAQARDIAKDLSFLRFDPEANCLKLENFDSPSLPKEEFRESREAKFPLNMPTPTSSPLEGRRRLPSSR